MEAVEECTGVVPVSCSNVASVIGGDTTAVGDDSKDYESDTSQDLDQTEHELGLTISLYSKELDSNQCDKKRNDPCAVVDSLTSLPEMDDVASGGDFEGEDREPTDCVLPTTVREAVSDVVGVEMLEDLPSETPTRINEADNVHGESTVDRVHDCQLCKSLHHEVNHESDNDESE